jgi:hypothetical protein
VDQRIQRKLRRRQEKELLLRVKPQLIQIAKTTRNLIKVKVEDKTWVDRVNVTISNGAASVLKTIKKSDRVDLLFLIIFPSPTWPVYFAYRGKIRDLLKPQKTKDSMKNIEEIRRKILVDYIWIKRVIESSVTPNHIKCCKRIIENWSNTTLSIIREYKCAFYKNKDFKKTVEVYRRSYRELSKEVAEKSVNISSSTNTD